MKIERRFTTPDTNADSGAYGGIAFSTTVSEIRNPDGTVVFRNDAVEVPAGWSQVASDVIAQKYFRKAGVPAALKRVKENEHLKLTPVVVLTTTDDEREIKRCYDLGANVYITKPVNYESFANAIRQLGLFFSVIQVPPTA